MGSKNYLVFTLKVTSEFLNKNFVRVTLGSYVRVTFGNDIKLCKWDQKGK